MATFYLVATLMVIQGVLFSYSMAQDDGSGPGPEPESGSGDDSGPTVKLTLQVSINCSGDNLLELTNSSKKDIKQAYKSAGFPIDTVTVIEDCEEEKLLFDAIFTLSFYSAEIPPGKTIKGVFQAALTKEAIGNLTASNTNFSIAFIGVTLTYVPKEGECQAICCDGAGGPLTLQQVCTPEDKCKGIEPAEKQEEGHCPGEEKATCPDTCEPKEEGPTVILQLTVTTNCGADNLRALNVSLQSDIKTVFTSEGFPIKSVITQSISCNSPLNIALELSFYSGIPSEKTINGVFQAALKDGKIRSLTESNTIYTATFTGVTFTYNPKDGQCQAICCGVGGALTVVGVCTPEDKCKGIEPQEKEEEGHCPGEEKATCPDTCDDVSGGIHNSPSYALVTLPAITTFTKTMFF